MSAIVPYTFRTKLMAILATTTAAFVVLIVVSTLLERRSARQLALIAEQHIPQLELGPRLEREFEHLRQGLQDAVAAQDMEALQATSKSQESCLTTVSQASKVIGPVEASALRAAVEDYYRGAYDVSRRLIQGETGESLVAAIGMMQAQQRRTVEQLDRVTEFDRRQLSESFGAAAAAQATATRVRLMVSASCLTAVLLLLLWVSGGVLRSLREVGAGFVRFGQGDFSVPIAASSVDEFGELAKQANQMATNLKRLGDERDRSDWLKEGHAGLVLELREGLEPAVAASHAAGYLARYLDSPAAVVYWEDGQGVFRLLGHHAGWFDQDRASPLPAFRAGEGLIGQCATQQGITVLRDLPADHLPLRSGLGQTSPHSIVLLPLVYLDKVVGILELAVVKPWLDSASELLLSVRETLAITIEVAQGRAALRGLLLETQLQAQRLATQEDTLRAQNAELQQQQQDLKAANGELVAQAMELEAQRHSLEQSNAELRDVRRTLEKKAQELTTVSAYKSRFMANMSHELRTPLNSMLLLSSLLAENKDGNLTPKQVEFCQTVHGAGNDLLSLINQVLDLAKVESGKQEVRPTTVRLSDFANYARRVFEPLARDKGLGFEVSVDAGVVPESITTDGKRVEQILNNLLGNAIKFTAQGEIRLHIGAPARDAAEALGMRASETVALTVTDTGVGVPEEHQERVFAPFEQLEGAPDRRYGGTGLGLSIARELANLLGGELFLQSVPGQGSTFTCLLPYRLSAVERSHAVVERSPAAIEPRRRAETAIARAPDAADTAHPEEAGIDLLVIEDDPLFSELLGEVITAQGLKYRTALDGQMGLQLARELKPKGIVLDVRLSDLDGFLIMERLQADPRTRGIPVHFVSALEGAERGLSLGAIGYLSKPATRGDLVHVVECLMRGAAARVCRLLVVEDDAELASSLLAQLALEGIEARRVSSASEALSLLARESFSCLIVDLGLPDMDGLEFLQTLEKQRGKDLPPVLVYTGRALSRDEVQRLEAHAEAVVAKEGLATERLLEQVRLFARRLADGLPGRRKLVSEAANVQTVVLDKRKILIADDDMRTVYALSALLQAEGAEVVAADNGRAALDILAEQPDVELVLMDIVMPEMDGFEALRQLRKQPRFRELPVIALTAKTLRIDRDQCIQAGATDYMQKPFAPERLLGMVRGRLALETARRAESAPTKLEVANMGRAG
jgi:CheY-like chemotaxis protein/signal transduction histidine kinase/HAMP domain-containing protein